MRKKIKIILSYFLYILKMDVKEEGMNIPLIEHNIYYPFDNITLVKFYPFAKIQK